MHVPPSFAVADPIGVLVDLLRTEPATLVTLGPEGLEATVVPLLLEERPGGHRALVGHVARGNRATLDGEGREAMVLVQGPQGYVSPSWYPSKAEHAKVVPTWDYVAVQVHGRLRTIDDAAWLRSQVRRLTDRHEAGREEPWSIDDAPTSFLERMLGGIVGVEVVIERVTAKAKLSQNRSAADVEGVIEGLRAEGPSTDRLADAVARPPEPPEAHR